MRPKSCLDVLKVGDLFCAYMLSGDPYKGNPFLLLEKRGQKFVVLRGDGEFSELLGINPPASIDVIGHIDRCEG